MTRFGNLEFDEGFEGESREHGVKDESFYFSSAKNAFESAEFEKALRWFAKVLEFNPQNAAAWTGQVCALIELGELREAVLWADKALERSPHEPELLASKGVAQGRDGKLDEAIALSDASIEERGDTPYIWLARADVLLARKESRADYCFDKALAIAPGDWVVPWLAARIRHYYKQITIAMKGLYTVFVDPYTASTGQVSVQLLADAPGTLAIDGAVFPVTLIAGQNGAYTFDGALGQNLGLGISALTTNPAGGSVTVTVYAPDNVTMLISCGSFTATNGGGNCNLPPLPSTGTTRYVSIRSVRTACR